MGLISNLNLDKRRNSINLDDVRKPWKIGHSTPDGSMPKQKKQIRKNQEPQRERTTSSDKNKKSVPWSPSSLSMISLRTWHSLSSSKSWLPRGGGRVRRASRPRVASHVCEPESEMRHETGPSAFGGLFRLVLPWCKGWWELPWSGRLGVMSGGKATRDHGKPWDGFLSFSEGKGTENGRWCAKTGQNKFNKPPVQKTWNRQ